MSFIIAAFYHFFDFPTFEESRKPLLELLKKNGIKGSVLIAPEGINATISGTREGIDAVLSYIETEIIKDKFEHKESMDELQPFGRAKVRLKKEIVTMGMALPPGSRRGKYASPKEWNALIADPDTVVIDARNHYEIHLGTFKNAIDPNTKSFSQLPAYVKKNIPKLRKVATFCTGGIRCEKFSSWLLSQGFEEVYQLHGGILKYLEEIPAGQSLFEGECYVFDERVAVGHGLAPSATATMCLACGHPLTPKDRDHHSYRENSRCPHCAK